MRAKILIVEDENDIGSFMVRTLNRKGFNAIRAETGKEALRLVELEKPEVILLDIMLPDIDGFEICKRVSRQHPEISIIMVTARGEDVDKIRGLELGADDYIIKPFYIMGSFANYTTDLEKDLDLRGNLMKNRPVFFDANHADVEYILGGLRVKRRI